MKKMKKLGLSVAFLPMLAWIVFYLSFWLVGQVDTSSGERSSGAGFGLLIAMLLFYLSEWALWINVLYSGILLWKQHQIKPLRYYYLIWLAGVLISVLAKLYFYIAPVLVFGLPIWAYLTERERLKSLG